MSTPPLTPQKRRTPSTPPTVSAKGMGAAWERRQAPSTTPATLASSPLEPQPKKQNLRRKADELSQATVVPVVEDATEEVEAIAAAAPTTLAKLELVSGRNGRLLSEAVINKCGACGRCKKPGHFRDNCPLMSREFKAKYRSTCPGCSGPLMPGQSGVRVGKGWWHPRCATGLLAQQNEETRRMLAGATAAAPGDEALAVRAFMRSRIGHALVPASAGSGKTRLLVNIAKDCVESGGRALVLAYNKAAEQELGKRGVREPKTFHAFGLAAW